MPEETGSEWRQPSSDDRQDQADPGIASASPAPISVLLIDAMTLTRECLSTALMASAPDLDVAGASPRDPGASGAAARPDLVLFNIKAAGLSDPKIREDLTKRLNATPAAPILVVADADDEAAAFEAIDMGARGYFPLSLSVGLLIAAIRLILAGGLFVSPRALRERTQALTVRSGLPGGTA